MLARFVSLSLVAALCVVPSVSAFAFKERWHKAIGRAALPFLRQRHLAEVLRVQDQMDEMTQWRFAGVDKWHFNDCAFARATDNIAQIDGQILAALAAEDAHRAATLFGQLLHLVQDFYAHSNWSELAVTGELPRLVQDWAAIKSWKPLPGTDVMPVSTEVKRPAATVVPSGPLERGKLYVEVAGKRYRALVTGEATLSLSCLPELSIGHWDDRADQARGLAKDYPCRIPKGSFQRACTFALRQTYQEWCRLYERAVRHEDPQVGKTLLGMITVPREEMDRLCAERRFAAAEFGGACR